MSGCYVGIPFVLWGGDEGLRKPAPLLDKAGDIMHTGRYWDEQARKHTSGTGPGERAYSALPLDWDQDGDLDLIVGTDKGGLYVRTNEGTRTEPAFATKVQAIHAGGKDARVPSGYAIPVAADWDGDGRQDLVSGSQDGAVYWFRNVGKQGKPELEPPRALVGSSDGAAGRPGRRSQVAVVDFDGDLDLDLLVGDNHMGTADGKPAFKGFIWLYRRVRARADEPEPASKSASRSAR